MSEMNIGPIRNVSTYDIKKSSELSEHRLKRTSSMRVMRAVWKGSKNFLTGGLRNAKSTSSIEEERLSIQSLPPLSPSLFSHSVSNFPKLWNAPQQNQSFIRRSCLDSMRKSLKKDSILVCHGLGGMGKTALVVELVRESYGVLYDGVAWFNAKNVDELLLQYNRLGQDLNLPYEKENDILQTRGRQVKRYLEDPYGNWLLVYDDVQAYDGPDGIEKWIPSPLKGSRSRVLITSRLSKGPYRSKLPIGKFSRDESIKCIKKILGESVLEKNKQAIHKLAKALKDLPLGLVLASAYVKRAQMEVFDYLTLYKATKKALKADSEFAPLLKADYARAVVYIHWSIAIEKIRNQSHLGLNWLTLCSYFANEIPDFLFKVFAEKDSHNNPHQESHEKAREILTSYSLFTINEKNGNGSMPSLLKEVIRMSAKESKAQEIILLDAAKLLQECVSKAKEINDSRKMQKLLPHFEALLPVLEEISCNVFQAKSSLLSHLFHQAQIYGVLEGFHKQQAFLERWLFIQEGHSVKNDIERAKALVNLGSAYGALGKPKKTKECIEKGLPILKEEYGRDHVEVVKALVDLGNSYGALKDPHKQKELLEEALPTLESYFGKDHVEVAKVLVDLGNCYRALGNLDNPKKLIERALPILEKRYGKDHIEVAKALVALGNACKDLRQNYKMKRVLEQALPILKKHYGEEHVKVAITLVNIGVAYGVLEDCDKKKDCLSNALSILEKRFGSDDVEVAKALIILGNAYGVLPDHQEKKKELFERALSILEKHHRSDDIEVAGTLVVLGNAYGTLGDLEEQNGLLKRSLPILESYFDNNPIQVAKALLTFLEEQYGSNDIQVGRALVTLGSNYDCFKDTNKKKELLERAVPILESCVGKDDIEVIELLVTLGSLYGCLGNHYQKKKLLERLLPILENHHGPNHVGVGKLCLNLGNAYGYLRNFHKQKELMERALRIFEEQYGERHVEVAKALVDLAMAYGGLGNLSKKRELLERALPIFEEQYGGRDHVEVAMTLGNLGNLHVCLGELDQAKKLIKEALAILKKHCGGQHFEVARVLSNLASVYGGLGESSVQKKHLEEALSIQEKCYGSDHFEVARTLYTLGNVYGRLQDPYKQEDLFARALTILEKLKDRGDYLCAFDLSIARELRERLERNA